MFAARGRNFLQTILRLARERDELSIVADQIGAPTWARNIADATALIVQRACRERGKGEFASGILNLTAAGATSWCGFAEAILDQAMRRQGVQTEQTQDQSDREFGVSSACGKAEELPLSGRTVARTVRDHSSGMATGIGGLHAG